MEYSQIHDIKDISYFIRTGKNSYKVKVKKLLTILATFIIENSSFNKDSKDEKKLEEKYSKSIYKTQFETVFKLKYSKLECARLKCTKLNSKECMICDEKEKCRKREEEKNNFDREDKENLEKVINASYKQAIDFIMDFRNILIHKNVRDDHFDHCKFKEFNAELFNFLKLCLDNEINLDAKYIEKIKKENPKLSLEKYKNKDLYIREALNVDFNEMKTSFKNVPFVYALMIIAMFTEKKHIKEILDLIKLKGYINELVLSFSLRGGYKTLVPGVEFDDDKLYYNQIKFKDKFNSEVFNKSGRIKKNIKDFDDKYDTVNQNKNQADIFYLYKKALKFYSYSNSFPKIVELEDIIRKDNTNKLIKIRKEKINKNAKNEIERKEKIDKLENSKEEIEKSLINVFRNEDIFMKEALNFITEYGKFGNLKSSFFEDTWSIVGNAAIWAVPVDKYYIDTRRKVKPSKNADGSIYKIVYNDIDKKNIDMIKYSINKYNLTALLTSIMISDNVIFNNLQSAASYLHIKKEYKNNNKKYNVRSLEDILKEKVSKYSVYQKTKFCVRAIRREIVKDKHIHQRDSIVLHDKLMMIISKLNVYSFSSPYESIKKAFDSIHIDIPDNIKAILKINTLDSLTDECIKLTVKFAENNKNKSKNPKDETNILYKSWSKYAFSPNYSMNKDKSDYYKDTDSTIYEALRWDSIKETLFSKEFNDYKTRKYDLLSILLKYFKYKNYTIPIIINFYEEYKSKNKIKKFRDNEIRNILAQEMILALISKKYANLIVHRNKYLGKNTSIIFEYNNRSVLDFDLVWVLKTPIRINIRDYYKKDVRNDLEWLLDPQRINKSSMKKEDLELSISNSIEAFNIIVQDEVLKNFINPTITELKEGEELDVIKVKELVRVLMWAAKEFLYFICAIESHLIYKCHKAYGFESIIKEDGYVDFNSLVNFNNDKMTPKISETIKDVRNMICHMRVKDGTDITAIDYKRSIIIINLVLEALKLNDIYKSYSNIK
ncbi:hypothetical protein A966_06175 [Brachyspira hampsonii 30446]|uniref:Uncharacterized protein n=3 Tax=Brachyspira hampsonii TaxID=1287055 RepID=A0A2U4EW64_9SPIR|nr:hypothetical protein [Brachyspira hampsonii]EKV57216.1 hypothetical protein A966_06175 [Brachyspira hampsonii 30446]OEJ12950.1 hypothetical protein A9495_01150 [Brachyspira hampsonii]